MPALIRKAGLGLTVMAIGFAAAGCGDDIKDKVDEAKTTYTDAKTTADDIQKTVDDASKKAEQAADDARKTADCINNAGGNADKIEACTR